MKDDLLARLEAATGPDRLLDAEIDCAVRFPDLRPAEPDDFAGKYGYSPGNIKVDTGFLMSASYTRSIDAALTLVPDGCGWSAGWGQILPDKPMGEARITRNAHFIGYDANYDVIVKANAATPALALCIAALRARAGDE